MAIFAKVFKSIAVVIFDSLQLMVLENVVRGVGLSWDASETVKVKGSKAWTILL